MLFAEVYEMAIDTMLICYLYAKKKGLLKDGDVPPEFLEVCNKEDEKMRDSIKLRESRVSGKDLAQAQPMEGDHGKSNVE